MRTLRHTFEMLMLLGVICLLASTGAWAAQGGFAFVSSSVEHDAEGVSRQPVIELTFNKNVVNMKVAEQNATCFTLMDAEENAVEIEVVMADDQIEPEKKRIIVVEPAAPLAPNASYALIISEALTAKNGETLGEDVSLTFTTGDEEIKDADETTTEE